MSPSKDTVKKQDHPGDVSKSSKAEAPEITERWESLFVYGFISRFTNLKDKLNTLNAPTDFEDAVVFPGSNPIMLAILQRFLTNLHPQCDTKPENIEHTLVAVIDAMLASSKERSIWWSESKKTNNVPLRQVPFFTSSWDVKLKVLRQLVDWQLAYCPAVKLVIDDAWGVKHLIKTGGKLKPRPSADAEAKGKGKGNKSIPPQAPPSKKDLELVPVGLDSSKRRFWIVDDSCRVWSSGNPWKVSCPMTAASSSREEYIQIIEDLKAKAPPVVPGEHRGKFQIGHDNLIKTFEARLPQVDEELARVEKVRRRIRDKEAAMARAMELVELRQTRTRARTKAVDYAAIENGGDSDEDQPMDDASDEDEWKDESTTTRRSFRRTASSSRASSASARSIDSHKRKRTSDGEWRGERRSSRLANGRFQLDEHGDPTEIGDSTTEGRNHDGQDSDVDGSLESVVRPKRRRIIVSEEDDDDDDDVTMTNSSEQALGSKELADTTTLPVKTAKIRVDEHCDAERRLSLETPSLVSDRDGHLSTPASTSSLSSLSDVSVGA